MVLVLAFFFMFRADKFVHTKRHSPQSIVTISIFSSKKINPSKVAKINLEKSKGIKFVSLEMLKAFVQQ